jgi:hypothetical protein
MNSCLPPYGRYPGAVTRICPSASLYRCAIYSGRLFCTQILEAADTIGVTTFLCRILDTAFGVFSTWHFGEWRLTLALPLRATMRRELCLLDEFSDHISGFVRYFEHREAAHLL